VAKEWPHDLLLSFQSKDFPIDVTDPDNLALMRQVAVDYMNEPEQQGKVEEIAQVLNGE